MGPQNLIDAELFDADDFPVGGSYKVEFREADTTVAYKQLEFEITDADCKGFETIRLAWVNSLGAWDYYNFTKRSTRVTTSKRKNFRQNYGYNQDSGSDGYDYGTYQGGLQTFNNTVAQTIEANTGYITEEEAAVLESLYTSSLVQMYNADLGTEGDWEPVIITEKEYVKQTTANDLLKQYVIEIQYSHNKRVQRV